MLSDPNCDYRLVLPEAVLGDWGGETSACASLPQCVAASY